VQSQSQPRKGLGSFQPTCVFLEYVFALAVGLRYESGPSEEERPTSRGQVRVELRVGIGIHGWVTQWHAGAGSITYMLTGGTNCIMSFLVRL
jgi:hypothetical protein